MATETSYVYQLLNENQEIIEAVLKNLCLRDLANASMVSKTWNKIARKYKRDTTVQITTNNYNDVKTDHYFKIETKLPLQFCITFMDYGVYDRHWYYLEKLAGNRKDLNLTPKYKKSHVHYQLKKCMTEECESMLINRPTRCINYIDCTDQIPNLLAIGYVTFGFPFIPGVKIQPFELDSEEKRISITSKFDIDPELKLLMVFIKADACYKSMNELLTRTRSEKYAIFEMKPVLKLQDARHEVDFIKGVAFSGSNLRISTVLIGEFDPDSSFSSLRKPDTVYFRHNSVAFLFHKLRRDVPEILKVFKIQFPNTPLISIECQSFSQVSEIRKLEPSPIEMQIILISWQ